MLHELDMVRRRAQKPVSGGRLECETEVAQASGAGIARLGSAAVSQPLEGDGGAQQILTGAFVLALNALTVDLEVDRVAFARDLVERLELHLGELIDGLRVQIVFGGMSYASLTWPGNLYVDRHCYRRSAGYYA